MTKKHSFGFINISTFITFIFIIIQDFYIISTNIFKRGFMITIILNFIKAIITYFWLKSKSYVKKVPVMTNSTIALTSAFVNIYNLCQHSPKKICGQYLLPPWKTDLPTITMYEIASPFSSSELSFIFIYSSF